MLKQSVNRNSCNTVIELALKVPKVQVLAIGPESCLRLLFFRASRRGLLDRLYMLPIKTIDLVTNKHLEALKDGLEEIINDPKRNTQAIIVYIACVDIVIGTDFRSVTQPIEEKYQIPIRVFARGPLSKRNMPPRDRLHNIFADIEDCLSNENQ